MHLVQREGVHKREQHRIYDDAHAEHVEAGGKQDRVHEQRELPDACLLAAQDHQHSDDIKPAAAAAAAQDYAHHRAAHKPADQHRGQHIVRQDRAHGDEREGNRHHRDGDYRLDEKHMAHIMPREIQQWEIQQKIYDRRNIDICTQAEMLHEQRTDDLTDAHQPAAVHPYRHHEQVHGSGVYKRRKNRKHRALCLCPYIGIDFLFFCHKIT